MMNIENEYDFLLKKYEEKKINLYRQIDQKIIHGLSMTEADDRQIQQILLYSPMLRNKPLTFIQQYFSELSFPGKKEQKTLKVLDFKKIYLDMQFPYLHNEILPFCEGYESEIAQKLLINWTLPDIQKTILNKNLLYRDLGLNLPKGELKKYCDRVLWRMSNRMLKTTSIQESARGKNVDLVQKIYLEKAELIQKKYNHFSFNAFMEGKVILDLILNHGYSADVLKTVLNQHTLNQNARHPGYEDEMLKACNQVKCKYDDIVKFSFDEYRQDEQVQALSLYKKFAKFYMEKTQATVLNGKDEQNIVLRLLNADVKKENILYALITASPVAAEPGRISERYIHTVFSAAHDEYEKNVKLSKETYTKAAKIYDAEITLNAEALERKKCELEDAIHKNRVYYDGMIVKRLLEEHYSSALVLKVIQDKSSQALRGNEENQIYAHSVVKAVQRQIGAEKAIIGFIQSERLVHMKYGELPLQNIKISDLYRSIIKERIDVYPDTALSLSDSAIDVDTTVKLMYDYEIDGEMIKDALREASPRAQMPGIQEGYVEIVIDKAIERLSRIQRQNEHTEEVRKEYLRQCGLANEGVEDKRSFMWQDGRAALKMLKNGMDHTEIRNVIAEESVNAKCIENVDAYVYASNLIDEAKKVIQRETKILNHALDTSMSVQSDENRYRHLMFEQYKEKGYLSSKGDIGAAMVMMYEGFDKQTVEAAILQYSPIAIEAGRGPQYSEYVLLHAEKELEIEKMKIERYRPVPRFEKEKEAQEEYAFHVLSYKNQIRLPITMQVDEMIATAMLFQGYASRQVSQALQQSTCADGLNYGVNILKVMEKTQEKMINKEPELCRAVQPNV